MKGPNTPLITHVPRRLTFVLAPGLTMTDYPAFFVLPILVAIKAFAR